MASPTTGLTAEEIAPFMDMSDADVADLVLMLLIEEMAEKRLAAFRPKDLSAQPVEGLGEFGGARDDVVFLGHALG